MQYDSIKDNNRPQCSIPSPREPPKKDYPATVTPTLAVDLQIFLEDEVPLCHPVWDTTSFLTSQPNKSVTINESVLFLQDRKDVVDF